MLPPLLFPLSRSAPPPYFFISRIATGVDSESSCLYLQHRELIYKATIYTTSVGKDLESNCLYHHRRDVFRKQLCVPLAKGCL